jgi:tetratricopeptide (TPR) repeat protein
MKFPSDSCLALFLAALLAASPAAAVTAKKPAKVHAKPAAATVEPQPDAGKLIIQARDAESRGESDLAVRLAQSAIVADPAHAASYDALGDVYAANNQQDYARSYYAEALSIDPTDPAAQKAVAALDRSKDKRAASAEGFKPGTP